VGRVVALALACVALTAPAADTAAAQPDTSPYAGLGTWVDIWATSTWSNPEAAVGAMAARHVTTLYLETGNYSQSTDLVRAPLLPRFVDAAHAAGLRVVAWYLPSLASPARDLRRALAAIRFTTPGGGRFDSFALDVEASVVRSVALRNARLEQLSARLRAAVGPEYALGAIIPSAVGMSLHPRYWPGFPYTQLAATFDVFLPMAYSTYHAKGAVATLTYVATSIQAIRDGVGDPNVPIHVIGGLTGGMGAPETAGFLRAVAACAPLGYSLYEFPTTKAAAWSRLVAPVAAPAGAGC
jgi:hypothetical protein